MNLAFALTGDVFTNSRALRQLDALNIQGVNGIILHFASPDRPQSYQGFSVLPISKPTSSGPRFFWDTHKAFEKAAKGVSADVFHASDLYCLPALAKRAAKTDAKLVFDSRELYHHVEATNRKPASRLFWRFLQRRLLPKTNLVFTVSNSIADFLVQEFHIPRPIVLPNTPKKPNPTLNFDLRHEFDIPHDALIVIHTGNIRKGRNCDLLVRSFAHTSNEAHLVLMGADFTNGQIVELIRQLGLEDRVHLKPSVKPSYVIPWTRSADIGASLLANSCLNHDFALPNKVFEYITAGIPVIGTDLTELSNLINSYEIGLVTELAPEKIGQSIQYVIDNPEQREKWKRNVDSAVKDYNWESTSERFVDAYADLLSS